MYGVYLHPTANKTTFLKEKATEQTTRPKTGEQKGRQRITTYQSRKSRAETPPELIPEGKSPTVSNSMMGAQSRQVQELKNSKGPFTQLSFTSET